MGQEALMVLTGAALFFAVWWFVRKQSRKEKFERVCMMAADAGHGRYWRGPVDYLYHPNQNPHYKADPNDEGIPLEGSPPMSRQLMPAFDGVIRTGGQDTPGCGDQVDTMPDDFASHISFYESGDLDMIRYFGSFREDGVRPTGMPFNTDYAYAH